MFPCRWEDNISEVPLKLNIRRLPRFTREGYSTPLGLCEGKGLAKVGLALVQRQPLRSSRLQREWRKAYLRAAAAEEK
jgi:hypothetical protein